MGPRERRYKQLTLTIAALALLVTLLTLLWTQPWRRVRLVVLTALTRDKANAAILQFTIVNNGDPLTVRELSLVLEPKPGDPDFKAGPDAPYVPVHWRNEFTKYLKTGEHVDLMLNQQDIRNLPPKVRDRIVDIEAVTVGNTKVRAGRAVFPSKAFEDGQTLERLFQSAPMPPAEAPLEVRARMGNYNGAPIVEVIILNHDLLPIEVTSIALAHKPQADGPTEWTVPKAWKPRRMPESVPGKSSKFFTLTQKEIDAVLSGAVGRVFDIRVSTAAHGDVTCVDAQLVEWAFREKLQDIEYDMLQAKEGK